MRNIFLFVRRYITFLTFIVLQLIAIWMLFKYNRFHHSIGLGIASEFTGSINKQVDKLDDYFHQSEENKRVHRMNDSLMNLLKINFSQTDTALKIVTDSLLVDSTKMVRRYLYREAKVVYNTVNVERNYMQINRGSKYGIKDNMAVLNSDGAAAGVVVNVSNNFSEVMSLLHIQNSVSGALKKTGDAGKIEWDGKDPKIVLLRGVSKSVPVQVGDTIVTSKYSYNFPPDKLIGFVTNVGSDPASGFYLLKVRTAVNFSNIQQVFVVENLQKEEQMQLEKDTEKKFEQQKRAAH